MRKILHFIMTLENLVREKQRIQSNYDLCLEVKDNLFLLKVKLLNERLGPLSQNAQNRINRNINSILDVIEPQMIKQQLHIENLVTVISEKDSSGLLEKTLLILETE